ncbi:MAG TPA: FAD-binding protein [Candidatus Wirthbacteria bacterium]|nr:FAD-binding protein [Candidatus Wirthbacteria bacterium]
MPHYNVIIIGAGPAGLKCAETLAGSKLKVLLIEQKNQTKQ